MGSSISAWQLPCSLGQKDKLWLCTDREDDKEKREKSKFITFISDSTFSKDSCNFRYHVPSFGCIYPGWQYLGFVERACSFIWTVRPEPFLGAGLSVQTLLAAPCWDARHHASLSMIFPQLITPLLLPVLLKQDDEKRFGIKAASCPLAARQSRQERTAAARMDSASKVVTFSFDCTQQTALLTGHFFSPIKHRSWLCQGGPKALGNPSVFNDLREGRNYGLSNSWVTGGPVGSRSLCSSLVMMTEITTNCFLLFYRRVSWEAYFAYSDSECCLLSCTYCMSVWNKSE